MIRYISTFDLLSNDEAKKIVVNEDYTKFYDLLFDIGFDINKEVFWEEAYCRSMISHNIICLGRWVGFERRDSEWLCSEYCTLENRILANGKKDPSLMLELSSMSKTANFTGILLDNIEREVGKGVEIDWSMEEDAIFDLVRCSNKYRKSLGEKM